MRGQGIGWGPLAYVDLSVYAPEGVVMIICRRFVNKNMIGSNYNNKS